MLVTLSPLIELWCHFFLAFQASSTIASFHVITESLFDEILSSCIFLFLLRDAGKVACGNVH